MPKESKILELIPKLYRRNAIDLVMFGYISSHKKILPSMSIENIIYDFCKEYNIDLDEFDIGSATRKYYKLIQDLIKLKNKI